jgi:hypothetical protein
MVSRGYGLYSRIVIVTGGAIRGKWFTQKGKTRRGSGYSEISSRYLPPMSIKDRIVLTSMASFELY